MANEQTTLADLKPAPGTKRNRKRIGRGNGSGNGTYAGKGQKGQQSRSGYSRRPWFEGGQMPIQRRLPKRGFTHIKKNPAQIVNLGDIGERTTGDRVDSEALKAAGLIRSLERPVKILAGGELNRAVTIVANAFSRAAREKIEAAKGTAEEQAGA